MRPHGTKASRKRSKKYSPEESIGIQMRLHQKCLKRNSTSSYRGFLLDLCSDREHLWFIPKFKALVKANAWGELLSFADSLASQKYEDANEHLLANQFALLVRKYPFHPKVVGTDPEGRSAETFLKSERKCARMNRVFDLFNQRSPYETYLAKCRAYIQYVIGSEPNMEQVYSECGFGSGASVGTHGNATHLAKKLLGEWSVSPSAMMVAFEAVSSHAQFADFLAERNGEFYCFDKDKTFRKFMSRIAITTHNKISFVPKTARTHRTIAVEPLLNGYVQKGIDNVFRRKLKRVGIDLSDQSRNQEMARVGSLNDSEESFVTIDLASASDSISTGLVRNLLPPEWFYLLDRTRSKNYELAGKVRRYNKFCSMGNGFCFPLETLIFVSVCSACGCGVAGDDFSVYGDDIIVRKKFADKVIWLLNKLGFVTNKSKTFLNGPFRESCGADWFGGRNVRPFTLDYKLDSIESVYKTLNITKERSSTEPIFLHSRPFLFGLLDTVSQLVRPFKGNHDSGIDGYTEEFMSSPNCRLSKRLQRWEWRELSHTPVEDDSPVGAGTDDYPLWMYTLLAGGTSSRSSRLPVKFYLRRETKATVVLTGHAGAFSTWLPGSGPMIGT